MPEEVAELSVYLETKLSDYLGEKYGELVPYGIVMDALAQFTARTTRTVFKGIYDPKKRKQFYRDCKVVHKELIRHSRKVYVGIKYGKIELSKPTERE